MTTRTWIAGCLALCLSACATLQGSAAKPENDLELLRLGVQQLTRERHPQGPVVRVEDAATDGQLFNLAIALEDTNWLQNDDKARLRAFVDAAVARIQLARRAPCRWWQLTCRADRKAAELALDNPKQPP